MDLLREAVWERGHKMGGGEKERYFCSGSDSQNTTESSL